MTPKYSAEWWEKVTAQPIKPNDIPPNTCSVAPLDETEIPQTKTKPRKSLCPQVASDRVPVSGVTATRPS
jgi:hypothetical protein